MQRCRCLKLKDEADRIPETAVAVRESYQKENWNETSSNWRNNKDAEV